MAKKKEFNKYKICGDYTIIYIKNQKDKIFEVLIDTEDLEKAKSHIWHIQYAKNNQKYYVSANQEYRNSDGKYKQKVILLYRYILNIANRNIHVDHENHDTLDNRKKNLRTTEPHNNSANREGANKNSSTGVRNVNWGWNRKYYYVQFMKDGIRYAWEFPLNQFKEACNFADIKRKEIFGEFAGNN